MLGLRFCARAFSSCSERGPLFIAARGPLTIAASLVAEHKLQTRRLSSCGSRAQLLRGMWGLPRPGLEPMSPALAGRFSTTAPPRKPYPYTIQHLFILPYLNIQMIIARVHAPDRRNAMISLTNAPSPSPQKGGGKKPITTPTLSDVHFYFNSVTIPFASYSIGDKL